MALIRRFKNENEMPMFSDILENFFGRNYFPTFFGNDTCQVPSVNIVETENSFRLEVAAPGFDKENFKISFDESVLTISGNKEEKKEDSREKYTRKEFSYASFERSFSLPENLDSDKIEAVYENGILKINIPKKPEEVKKPAREIVIK